MDLLISYLPNLWIFRYPIFMRCISLFSIHCMLFYILTSPFLFSDDRSLDLLFQLMFVCIYWWNMFLWHIAAGSKYLQRKNHIKSFIFNDMIIGFFYVLSAQSLNIWITYFHVLHCILYIVLQLIDLYWLYIVSHPYLFFNLLWWSIIGPFVSIDVYLFISMKYISMI